MSQANPSREDFAALLQESFAANDLAEGYVAKGIVTAIEKDVAIVDVVDNHPTGPTAQDTAPDAVDAPDRIEETS